MQAVVTIATASHQSLVRVLVESLHAHDSSANVIVYWLDHPVDVPGAEARLASRCVAAEDLAELATRYDQSEVCFAMKPRIIAQTLADGFTLVRYLDADMCAFASLTGLQEFERGPINLTPHRLTQNRNVDDDVVLSQAGLFNAGYLSIKPSETTSLFLDWWWSRTQTHASVAVEQGLCGDQRWLDQAPILWPEVNIIRHRGLNVGHWNVDERPIQRSGDRWLAGGERLVLFHFSGADPERTDGLSVHSPAPVEGDLEKLLREYRARVASFGGFPPAPISTPPSPQPLVTRVWDAVRRRVLGN